MDHCRKTVEVKQLQSDARLMDDPAPDISVRPEVDHLTLAMRQLMQVPGGGTTAMK